MARKEVLAFPPSPEVYFHASLMVFLRTVTAVLGAAFAITVCGGEMPVAEAESVGMSTERLQRIDTAMQRHIDAGKIQGAVTALARRGKVVHFKAHGLMDVGAERPMSRDAIFIIPTLREVPLDFQPGSRRAYSGTTGLDVVARIIEIVSGVPFNAFVQTRIFDPLEMHDTHYNLPPSKAPRRVAIRGSDMSGWFGETTYFSGSFGLSSTARDYLHFQQMLTNGGELFGRRLLSPRTVTMMTSDHVGWLSRSNESKGGAGYAVGVVLDPIAADSRRSAGAFGSGGAFGTVSWSDPAEEIAGVIMLQQPYGSAIYDFENAVRQEIID